MGGELLLRTRRRWGEERGNGGKPCRTIVAAVAFVTEVESDGESVEMKYSLGDVETGLWLQGGMGSMGGFIPWSTVVWPCLSLCFWVWFLGSGIESVGFCFSP